MVAKAKLFMHGRSQAVRLPKEFRLPGKEVLVSRDGDKVVLGSRSEKSVHSTSRHGGRNSMRSGLGIFFPKACRRKRPLFPTMKSHSSEQAMFCLDTNVVIFAMNLRRPGIAQRLDAELAIGTG